MNDKLIIPTSCDRAESWVVDALEQMRQQESISMDDFFFRRDHNSEAQAENQNRQRESHAMGSGSSAYPQFPRQESLSQWDILKPSEDTIKPDTEKGETIYPRLPAEDTISLEHFLKPRSNNNNNTNDASSGGTSTTATPSSSLITNDDSTKQQSNNNSSSSTTRPFSASYDLSYDNSYSSSIDLTNTPLPSTTNSNDTDADVLRQHQMEARIKTAHLVKLRTGYDVYAPPATILDPSPSTSSSSSKTWRSTPPHPSLRKIIPVSLPPRGSLRRDLSLPPPKPFEEELSVDEMLTGSVAQNADDVKDEREHVTVCRQCDKFLRVSKMGGLVSCPLCHAVSPNYSARGRG